MPDLKTFQSQFYYSAMEEYRNLMIMNQPDRDCCVPIRQWFGICEKYELAVPFILSRDQYNERIFVPFTTYLSDQGYTNIKVAALYFDLDNITEILIHFCKCSSSH
jgi:hypothetical protein